MAKIRKIYDQTIKPDGSKTTIYPITSVRAVFAPDGSRLDKVLANLHVDLPYIALNSTSDLPPEENHNGYLIGENLYVWVGAGGDTLDGKYQNCGPFKGPRGTVLQPDNEDIRETEQHTLQLADRSNLEGMGYIILRRSKSFAEQIVEENTIYEIRYEFDLDGSEVEIPNNCILKFNGGKLTNGTIDGTDYIVDAPEKTIVFDGVHVKNAGNAKMYTDWFEDPETSLQDLVSSIKLEELHFHEAEFSFSDISLNHNLAIYGHGATIIPEPSADLHNCKNLFTVSDGEGEIRLVFKDLNILGSNSLVYDALAEDTIDCLFRIRNCKDVVFDNLSISNIIGAYGTSVLSSAFHAGLIACIDVENLSITNCEFYNNYLFEWICNFPIDRYKRELNVVFDNNYIHNSSAIATNSGATPVFFVCDKLSVCGNIIDNYKYDGSLFNVHGNVCYFNRNIIKNSIASSVFDTCEYGDPALTEKGELVYYSDTVYCCDNVCDCKNGTLVVTWASNIYIEDNNVRIGVLLYEKAPNFNDFEHVAPYIVDNIKNVVIRNNYGVLDNFESGWRLPSTNYKISMGSPFAFGGSVEIYGNTFVVNNENDTNGGILINNAESISIKENTFIGILKRISNTYRCLLTYDNHYKGASSGGWIDDEQGVHGLKYCEISNNLLSSEESYSINILLQTDGYDGTILHIGSMKALNNVDKNGRVIDVFQTNVANRTYFGNFVTDSGDYTYNTVRPVISGSARFDTPNAQEPWICGVLSETGTYKVSGFSAKPADYNCVAPKATISGAASLDSACLYRFGDNLFVPFWDYSISSDDATYLSTLNTSNLSDGEVVTRGTMYFVLRKKAVCRLTAFGAGSSLGDNLYSALRAMALDPGTGKPVWWNGTAWVDATGTTI